MERNIKTDLIEYSSLILVVSYFGLHNIYIVFLGINLAIYAINKKLIHNKIKDNIVIKNIIKNKKEITSKKSKLSLVEIIEESGFIPSKDKIDDRDAA